MVLGRGRAGFVGFGQGVGRHPAVGHGLMSHADLAAAIDPPDPPPPGVTRRRHDEV